MGEYMSIPADDNLQQQFDAIRHVDGDFEYWSARELTPLLGYEAWRRLEETINRACTLCECARQDTSLHFLKTTKAAQIGFGAVRNVTDYHLTRYALFLIALCGDWRKPALARLLAYLSLSMLDRDYLAQAQSLGISISSHVAMTKEDKTIGVIERAFRHLNPIRQFRAAGYYVDLYFPDHNIAVECDEDGHRKIPRQAEAERQRVIEQALGCTFVRYNPDSRDFDVGDVINEIMRVIYAPSEPVQPAGTIEHSVRTDNLQSVRRTKR